MKLTPPSQGVTDKGSVSNAQRKHLKNQIPNYIINDNYIFIDKL